MDNGQFPIPNSQFPSFPISQLPNFPTFDEKRAMSHLRTASRDRRWETKAWIGALLAGGLLALTTWLALAAPMRGFLHMTTNLSQRPARWSNFADIAVAPDGDRVAVVWPEAYADGGDPRGNVYLRWASEGSGSGWSSPLLLFSGSATNCAFATSVAVTGTTAHVAYAVSTPCENPTQQTIYYRTCPLVSGGWCAAAVVIAQISISGSDPGYGAVDLALDAQSNPHFVYSVYRMVSGSDIGTVYYCWRHDGTTEPEWQVSPTGQDTNNPSIAWANNVVHVVWENEVDDEIWYRRKSGTTWSGATILTGDAGSDVYAPRNPDVTARDSRVIVVWDWHYPIYDPNDPDYIVAYRRSDNSGSGWVGTWREVGTDLGSPTNFYTSTAEAIPAEYNTYLRPSVALDGWGRPTVVWHADQGAPDAPDYDLFYTQATTLTLNNVIWGPTTRLNAFTTGQSASPRVALSGEITPHLHVACLFGNGSDWETVYESNEAEGYSFLYLPVIRRSSS